MSKYLCNFCNTTFSSAKSLDNHKKYAKYCLTLQDKVSDKNKCDSCQKSFCNRSWLIQHQLNCTEYKISLKTEDLLKENTQLKLDIENLRQTHISIIEEKDKKLKEKDDALLEKEKISKIVAEEVKDDDEYSEYSEYSKITLNHVVISSRPIDHYVNITQLCQAGEKKFNEWFRLDTTKELLNELSSDTGIQASELIESKRGGNSNGNGNWIHPDLAIQLAQWISPKFAIQVSKWVRNLFSKGSVDIDLARLREKEKDIRIKEERIKKLENVCLSKQRRVEYPERNVIYMITTEDHLLRRTYIIGKAKNLTQRLSTYNKTCDHIVIHYRECKNEEDMDTAEMIVLNKLKDYREQANRDRFILPVDRDEMLFIQIIDSCIKFLV